MLVAGKGWDALSFVAKSACACWSQKMTGTKTSALAVSAALLLSTQLDGRQSPNAAPQERREAPPFRVGVDAVRIDAVVTDCDGRIVSDLTADDFEVRQDGKRQTVTFAQFMPVLISAAKPPAGHFWAPLLRPRPDPSRPQARRHPTDAGARRRRPRAVG